jgi:hypothetical protein
MTRHCWKCGEVYTLAGEPGRTETCSKCRSDLKVCRNCRFHDSRAAHECRETRAEPVAEKHLANYCEFFELARREFAPFAESTGREAAARDALRKLFGD